MPFFLDHGIDNLELPALKPQVCRTIITQCLIKMMRPCAVDKQCLRLPLSVSFVRAIPCHSTPF